MGSRTQLIGKSLADTLFGKTKKAVITKLFSRPENSWHLRELARIADVSPTMLSKEINALSAAGIVREERDGNRRRFQANPECPIFDELRGIARKTAGLVDIVKDALLNVSGIEYAFIFGSVARGEEGPGSDVDVCVIGSALNRDVVNAVAAVEEAVGRPINVIAYRTDELQEKVASESYFVSKMLASKKMFLIGNADELERTTHES